MQKLQRHLLTKSKRPLSVWNTHIHTPWKHRILFFFPCRESEVSILCSITLKCSHLMQSIYSSNALPFFFFLFLIYDKSTCCQQFALSLRLFHLNTFHKTTHAFIYLYHLIFSQIGETLFTDLCNFLTQLVELKGSKCTVGLSANLSDLSGREADVMLREANGEPNKTLSLGHCFHLCVLCFSTAFPIIHLSIKQEHDWFYMSTSLYMSQGVLLSLWNSWIMSSAVWRSIVGSEKNLNLSLTTSNLFKKKKKTCVKTRTMHYVYFPNYILILSRFLV